MKTIAFTNQKGGVAKSTSCINIAAILGERGYKTLIIDLDPQANATIGVGIDWDELEGNITVYDCISKEIPIHEAIMKTKYKNISIVPAFITLANAEIEISAKMGRETLLKESLNSSVLDFDFIFLDLPPTLGLLTVNGLVASSDIIIPVDTGIFAMSGIQQLISIISLIKKKFNSNLNILGVLMTKVDSRTNLSKDIYNSLENLFQSKLFKNVIHQNVKIAEAQEKQMPINYYDKKSSGYLDYNIIVSSILEKIK